jgi:hypothetical protein
MGISTSDNRPLGLIPAEPDRVFVGREHELAVLIAG